MRTVRCTGVAGPLAIRTGLGARLQSRIVLAVILHFHWVVLVSLLSDCSDSGKDHTHYDDSTKYSCFHESLLRVGCAISMA
jgi:hypothetical protein